MGLEKVNKVAAGPNNSVYALTQDNKILKYIESKKEWVTFGTKHNGYKVTVDGFGNIFLQDRANTLWMAPTKDLLDSEIYECRELPEVDPRDAQLRAKDKEIKRLREKLQEQKRLKDAQLRAKDREI